MARYDDRYRDDDRRDMRDAYRPYGGAAASEDDRHRKERWRHRGYGTDWEAGHDTHRDYGMDGGDYYDPDHEYRGRLHKRSHSTRRQRWSQRPDHHQWYRVDRRDQEVRCDLHVSADDKQQSQHKGTERKYDKPSVLLRHP